MSDQTSVFDESPEEQWFRSRVAEIAFRKLGEPVPARIQRVVENPPASLIDSLEVREREASLQSRPWWSRWRRHRATSMS